MPNFRRNYVAGGSYFFTAVTHERRPILTTDLGRECLHNAIAEEGRKRPFELVAIVLLPDHLHTIWTLPDGDDSYSTRWRRIKERFTKAYLKGGGTEGTQSTSRIRHNERGIWQHRFWEHTIRDEDDFERCLNYIHWNPVKHGLAKRAADYPWSSFQRFVELGEYAPEWGTGEVPRDIPGAEWE